MKTMPRFIISALAAVVLGASAFTQTATVQVFKDGMAQTVPGFKKSSDWIQHDLWVEADFDSDGDGDPDRLHVDVTRPLQTKTESLKVHVIYETSPYFSGVGSNGKQYFWDPKHELGDEPPMHEHPPAIRHGSKRPVMSRTLISTWVPRGFAVVHSASPGTGLSEGCPTVGGTNEAQAPKCVIDWLNGRAKAYTSVDGDEEVVADWCTGNVGMTGTSYNGTLPLAAATTGVEGLKAIIPVSPNTSYYHYYRSHGLVRHPGGYMGEDVDVLYDFINSGYPEGREWCDCNVRDEILVAGADRLTGDLNDFWAGRNYANQLGDLKAAVLLAHGFNDWNVMPDHSVRIYEGLKAKGTPCQIYLHQGGHGGPPPADQMNRWFTRYVCGVENDVEKDARSWVVREGESRKNPTAYAEYPHPEAEEVDVFPNGDGTGVGTLGGKRGKGVQVLVDDVAFKGGDLAKVGSSNHRLLFATPILKQDLHLSGYSELTIRLASSRPAANLSVWLVSLPWTAKGKINANLVTRGWADPQNQTSLRESEALIPGEFVELSFTLQPDDQVIPAGQQLGLMIFSSDREFTLWPKAGTELSVDLGGTSLSLPVVGGEAALKLATEK